MLNLSEQWKEAYAEYLEEQESKIPEDVEQTCMELSEAQKEISNAYDLLEEYYQITLNEFDPGEAPAGSTVTTSPDGRNINVTKTPNNDDNNSVSDLKPLLNSLLNLKASSSDSTYEPSVMFTQERISDMGFGAGLLFVLKQLGKWIVNVVVYFIEKFKNILRRLTGSQPVELDSSKLIPDFKKVKKIEQIATNISVGSGKSSLLNAYKVDAGDISLTEETLAQALGIAKKDKDKGSHPDDDLKDKSVIVTVDLSRDLLNLRELVDHFYYLFDNAYGSNNEKLFATDDLKVILDLFKDSIERVKKGDMASYSYRGTSVEVSGISGARVRDNLQLTTTNIRNLKNAYVQTAEKIKDISRIINTKEMMMLSSMGVDFRLLTSSTYEQLKRLLDTIPERFKEASKMEKELTKMQAKYEKVVKELTGMQRVVQSISNVNFDTIYNRHLIELLNSSKYMTQTVSLRLTGIGLYIRELKDIRDALAMLLSINKGSTTAKKLYKF